MEKKPHTLGTGPKSRIKIIERGIIDNHSTKMHYRALACLGTETSVKWCGYASDFHMGVKF
jgi:hypothetical protein